MAMGLRKRASASRSALPPRPGQHVSLSPIHQRRLRTLPLPFDDAVPASTNLALAPALHDASPDASITETDVDNSSLATAASSDSSSTGTTSTVAQSLQAQRALVAQLSREVKRIEVAGRVKPNQLGRRSAVFSSGCSLVDGCLPYGGYESGTIIEYLQNTAGSGATTLAMSAAREALAVTDRFCIVVDWRQQFYPPAAAAMGLDLKRIIIVRPTTLADRLWAIDQALRSPSIVAVIAEIEQLDDHAARRLQLAAESGGGLGLLIRSSQRQHPSWAEIQWLVRPLVQSANAPMAHRPLQLELLRVRGGQHGSRVNIQVNATTGRLEPATVAAAALARTLARRTVAQQSSAESGRELGLYRRTS